MRPDQEIYRRVVEAYNGAKVFGLTTDDYVGMFPPYAQAGDVIAVQFGGHWPFVLRKQPDTANIYQLVGEYYIHDIMEGELSLPSDKYKPHIL